MAAPSNSSPETSTASATPAASALSGAQDPSKKIEDLETRLKALEDEVAAQKSAAAASPEATPNPMDQVGPVGSYTAPTGTGGGVQNGAIPWESGDEIMYSESRYLSFTNKAGDTEFRLGGYDWTDLDINNETAKVSNGVTQYSYVNGNLANNVNGFVPRKAHLDFRATFDKFVGAAIGIESDKSTEVSIGVYHAYAYAKFDKAFTLMTGKMTNPLSLEGDQPSADLPFVEASMIANLTINKTIGAMAEGKVEHLGEYELEVDNGAQDNESSATGPGKPTGDFKDLTGRVFLTPWEKSDDAWLQGLGFGGGASVDNETQEDTEPWAKMESSIGGNSWVSYGSNVVPDGPYYHVDEQGYYYNGPFGVLGEHVDSIQTVCSGTNSQGVPNGVPVALDNSGWLTEAQWVFGGKAGFEGAEVDHPFNPSKGQWGALELVARVDMNIMDVKSFTTGFAYAPAKPLAYGWGQAIAYGVGFNWWLNENFKFMCDGEETDCSGGNALLYASTVNAKGGTNYGTGTAEQILVTRAALTF